MDIPESWGLGGLRGCLAPCRESRRIFGGQQEHGHEGPLRGSPPPNSSQAAKWEIPLHRLSLLGVCGRGRGLRAIVEVGGFVCAHSTRVLSRQCIRGLMVGKGLCKVMCALCWGVKAWSIGVVRNRVVLVSAKGGSAGGFLVAACRVGSGVCLPSPVFPQWSWRERGFWVSRVTNVVAYTLAVREEDFFLFLCIEVVAAGFETRAQGGDRHSDWRCHPRHHSLASWAKCSDSALEEHAPGEP
jgi:hypothetical protein